MLKKFLVLALGVVLVVAAATSAMADTKVDFSGTFRVRAFYNNNFTLQGKSDWESKRSYLDQRLRIDLKLMPSENLTLNLGLTTEDQTWGQQGTKNFFSRPYGATNGVATPVTVPTATSSPAFTSTQTNFELRYFWADIKTPIGLFSVGRQPGSTFGLGILGWSGSKAMPAAIGDSTSLGNSRDRIKWTQSFGSLTLTGIYDKMVEADASYGENGLWPTSTRKYDQDWDEYSVTGTYKFENGGVTLTVAYNSDKSQVASIGSGLSTRPTAAGGGMAIPLAGLIPKGAAPYVLGSNPDVDASWWTFTPAVSLNFGPVGLHAESTIMTGSAKWLLGPHPAQAIIPGTNVWSDVKDNASITGFQFYADATYNYGPGLVGLQYAYTSGDKSYTDYTIDGMLTVDSDFTPFLIVYDRGLNIGLDQPTTRTRGAFNDGLMTEPYRSGNHWMLGAWVDHSLTEDLLIHAAFGYFDVVNPGTNLYNGKSINKHFGSELDVSLIYTIMNNLTNQLDIGYFWSGNYFKQGWSNGDEAARNGFDRSVARIGNAYAVKNTLTMKF
ncbi:MAG: porin [Deltaproteobacteria bacterium]|nr:porin [Deltaproteobacteria bacterium]